MAGRATSVASESAPGTEQRSPDSAATSPAHGGLRLELPPTDELLYFAGVGALAALEVIEWPVALVAAMGLALARRRPRRSSPSPDGAEQSPDRAAV